MALGFNTIPRWARFAFESRRRTPFASFSRTIASLDDFAVPSLQQWTTLGK
jgi:hypothetical protein